MTEIYYIHFNSSDKTVPEKPLVMGAINFWGETDKIVDCTHSRLVNATKNICYSQSRSRVA